MRQWSVNAGDVIADVNRAGNWIRGLELLGTAGFSLERALAPFSPSPGHLPSRPRRLSWS